MSLLRWKWCLPVLILCQIGMAQQPTRDPQGIALLTRALNVAGGSSALLAISDFTAKGKITYYLNSEVEGDLTVRARGLHQFRLDGSLDSGQRSWIVSGGSAFQKNADGSISPLPSQNTVKIGPATFPLFQVLEAFQDSSYAISYGGIVTHDGQQVHDIVVQKTFANDPAGALSKITRAHIFVDQQALTIQSVEDSAYAIRGPGEFEHEMQFSNYQAVNGILVPFTVVDLIAGQKTTAMQLNQIAFNTGLTDADFK